jgi:hypothetical protein
MKKNTKNGITGKKKSYRKNRSDNRKTIIKKYSREDEPSLAKKNWPLWELCRDSLTSGDIEVLITFRKQTLKHEKDPDKIKKLRNDIALLENAHIIKKRKEE